MVRLIWLHQFGKFAIIPGEIAAVYNNASYLNGVAIHVFRSGVDDNICAKFHGAAQDGRSKGVVHDQGDLMGMGNLRKFFNIENGQSGVGQRFPEN